MASFAPRHPRRVICNPISPALLLPTGPLKALHPSHLPKSHDPPPSRRVALKAHHGAKTPWRGCGAECTTRRGLRLPVPGDRERQDTAGIGRGRRPEGDEARYSAGAEKTARIAAASRTCSQQSGEPAPATRRQGFRNAGAKPAPLAGAMAAPLAVAMSDRCRRRRRSNAGRCLCRRLQCGCSACGCAAPAPWLMSTPLHRIAAICA